MEAPSTQLLSIGRFASLSGLSRKALRLYAELGLLAPTHVDPFTGYRYYDTAQLETARFIHEMREMEMPLGEIRRVLAVETHEAALLLEKYERSFVARLGHVQQMGAQLKHTLRQKERNMAIQLETRNLQPQQVVSLEGHVLVDELDNFIDQSLERLGAFVMRQGGRVSGPPLGLYHGPINHEDDGPIEVCLPADGAFRAEGDIRIRELPGGPGVVAIAAGEYAAFPKILEAYDAGYDWITQQGYTCVESPREVWIANPQTNGPFEIIWRYEERGRR